MARLCRFHHRMEWVDKSILVAIIDCSLVPFDECWHTGLGPWRQLRVAMPSVSRRYLKMEMMIGCFNGVFRDRFGFGRRALVKSEGNIVVPGTSLTDVADAAGYKAVGDRGCG
eukprot:scaffold149571_cov36-Cyclotella_meneghiniana.AAC.1